MTKDKGELLEFSVWTCMKCGEVGGFTFPVDSENKPLRPAEYQKKKEWAKSKHDQHNCDKFMT